MLLPMNRYLKLGKSGPLSSSFRRPGPISSHSGAAWRILGELRLNAHRNPPNFGQKWPGIDNLGPGYREHRLAFPEIAWASLRVSYRPPCRTSAQRAATARSRWIIGLECPRWRWRRTSATLASNSPLAHGASRAFVMALVAATASVGMAHVAALRRASSGESLDCDRGCC